MGAGRRIALGLAGLALAVAGCGGGGGTDGTPARHGADPVVPFRTDGLDRVLRAEGVAAAAAWRRAELTRLAGVATVGAALRRARLARAIGPRQYRSYRRAFAGA